MSRGKAIGLGIVAVILVIGIPWGAWAIRVATSDVVGQGNAIINKNSAQNRTAAQAKFEDLYAEIVATDAKITTAHRRLESDPEDRTSKDIAFGTENVCLSMIADYNAEARKYLAADFRAFDLPAQIDTNDPATDCQGDNTDA